MDGYSRTFVPFVTGVGFGSLLGQILTIARNLKEISVNGFEEVVKRRLRLSFNRCRVKDFKGHP